MIDVPSLETERLRLRPYRMDDFEAYAAMWAEPAVVRFVGGLPTTREAAWSRFLRHVGLWHYLGFGYFAVACKVTGAFVGEAGFHDLRRDMAPSLEGTLEAGWALVGPMQGRGLAEEAMRAALGWADGLGAGRRTTCIVDPANAASLRIAGKLGFGEVARSVYGGRTVVVLERPGAGGAR